MAGVGEDEATVLTAQPPLSPAEQQALLQQHESQLHFLRVGPSQLLPVRLYMTREHYETWWNDLLFQELLAGLRDIIHQAVRQSTASGAADRSPEQPEIQHTYLPSQNVAYQWKRHSLDYRVSQLGAEDSSGDMGAVDSVPSAALPSPSSSLSMQGYRLIRSMLVVQVSPRPRTDPAG